VVFNRQRNISIPLESLRAFSRRLSRELDLRRDAFDVALIDDAEIQRLNAAFRGKHKPTDVLSFPWQDGAREVPETPGENLSGFLGDVIISVETARRNARKEGHSLPTEIQQLMLHGLLHLLGYDHETDRGEMNALEMRLRQKLGIERLHRRPSKI
jgi:probable rRNA maturation factor